MVISEGNDEPVLVSATFTHNDCTRTEYKSTPQTDSGPLKVADRHQSGAVQLNKQNGQPKPMKTENTVLVNNKTSEIPLSDVTNGQQSPTSSEDSSDKRPVMSRCRISWNLMVLCCCYLLFYTGFWALTNLQSTMNAESRIGSDSEAVITFCCMLSSLFLPEVTIEKFGCRRVLIFGMASSIPFVAANMHLRRDTMTTSAVLCGLSSGPLSAALFVYVDEMGLRFEKTTAADNGEFVMACFFGFFTFFVESAQVWGNAISFYVLKSSREHKRVNETRECGVLFDMEHDDENENLALPTDGERFLLVGIFVGMGVLAIVLLALFLDPLENDVKEGVGWSRVLIRVKASVSHWCLNHQILLIPLTIYIGIDSAFFANEFTQAYIACSWGVHHVGFVTVCFGVCGAAMALLVGPLVKCVSQMAVLLLAAAANAVTCALLFFWTPSPDSVWEYFVFAGVWGMGDAIWWSQVTALYGLMFPNDREAAFSNLYFWSFLGFFLSYSYANYFSVAVKISILLGFLGVGIFGYLVGQIKLKCYSPRHEYLLISDDH